MLNPGTKIYECRSRRGWTQAQLAQKIGIAQANLSNIEKEKRDLTVSTLLRVASALNVRAAELIEEDVPQQTLRLTRTQIEALAKAVLHPKEKTSAETRKLAGLFRDILPGAGPRVSSKKIQGAWTGLRRRFSSTEIQGICRRIEDARQRAHA